MTARLRIVAYLVQPQLMADDGDSLTPLPVQPLAIPAVDWPNVVELVAAGIEQLRSQVEGSLTIVADAESMSS